MKYKLLIKEQARKKIVLLPISISSRIEQEIELIEKDIERTNSMGLAYKGFCSVNLGEAILKVAVNSEDEQITIFDVLFQSYAVPKRSEDNSFDVLQHYFYSEQTKQQIMKRLELSIGSPLSPEQLCAFNLCMRELKADYGEVTLFKCVQKLEYSPLLSEVAAKIKSSCL